MKNINYSKETDTKWQKRWTGTELYKFDETKMDKKFYLLEMFSYPSGRNLHIGHWWNYGLSDSYGRFKRMQGYQLFHPPGFDAFGLPAENYAIKTGLHPSDSTKNNVAVMEEQFRAMGTTYDWDYEIVTCNEEYYKWNQWLFLKLFEKGLAYRKNAPVNWCPSCMTVLANEQAADGKCERCDSSVIRRNMTQWFFKITEYAEELLSGLDTLDWPEKTRVIQKNWIGKSSGTEIDFMLGDEKITVFTTRADTLMGVTYLVLAPEHPLVDKITTAEYAEEVSSYCEYAAKQSEIERMSTIKEKTGVFTGAYAVHPITGEQIKVFISDYVLLSYGTGAVMAVPAHDVRDYEFAIKYSLPVKQVVKEADNDAEQIPFCGDGILINSRHFSGLTSEGARKRISDDLKNSGKGSEAVKYRLRDWLVSRQRYWGTPIPIIHCKDCGAVPVPENELPVRLPYNVEFRPDGRSPLTTCSEFKDTICPVCGKQAERDTDTLDTFVCSSWYFLRFGDNKNADEPFSKEKVSKLMPVDKYVGGVEHASMHLLYARFITKALRDMGCVSFDEPFPSLFHQGIIAGTDGKKISKRDGAISPDVYIDQYGSDIFRMYLGFGFSYLDGGKWEDDGIKSAVRFAKRIISSIECFMDFKLMDAGKDGSGTDEELEYVFNYTIKQVSANLEQFRFNSAIARIMEYLNAIEAYQKSSLRNKIYEEKFIKNLIIILAPLAPHLTEELWEYTGGTYSVHDQMFPDYDSEKLIRGTLDIAVQVNGRLREVISIARGMEEEEIKAVVLADAKIQTYIGECDVKKMIYVKDKLVNVICR